MTKYTEGQEVEVYVTRNGGTSRERDEWRKAKIAHYFDNLSANAPETYGVFFSDGSRAVFDAAHIRAIIRVGFDEVGSMVIE